MWNEYLVSIGKKCTKINHTLKFEHFFMLIEAAINGQGVALIPRFLIEHELLEGTLLLALNFDYQSPFSYYFICKKNSINLEKNIIFKNWLFSKVSHS